MTSISAFTAFPNGITEAQKDLLATREWVWLQPWATKRPDGTFDWSPEATDWPSVHQLNRDLRARNPKIKIGVYCWAANGLSAHSPAYAWVPDDWLIRRADGGPVKGIAPETNWATKLVDLANQTWQTYHIWNWVDWASGGGPDNHPPYDGILLDNANTPDQMAALALTLAPGGVQGGAGAWPWHWTYGMQYLDRLRWALEEHGKSLWVNGISIQPGSDSGPMSALGSNYVNLLDHVSGVLAEHSHRLWREDTCVPNLQMLQGALAKRRQIHVVVQPSLFDATDPGLVWTHGEYLNQYYLAAYKLIEEPGLTQLSIHDGPAYAGSNNWANPAVYVPYVWDSIHVPQMAQLGHAMGPAVVNDPGYGIAWRPFSNGFAAVNYTSAPEEGRPIRLYQSVRIGNPATGPLINVDPNNPATWYYNAPPKFGGLFFNV